MGSATTTFTYSGNLLMQLRSPTFAFDFLYDASGRAVGMWYENANGARSRYFYERNLQGDIVAIVNNLGEIRATYAYDAWGNCTVTNTPGYGVGTANPIRYRGYYQDTETGFYFLQTRYYDPEVKRFINADSLFVAGNPLTGSNMYAYCSGNPVMRVDPSGMGAISPWTALGLALHIVVVPFALALNFMGLTDESDMYEAAEDWFLLIATLVGEDTASSDGQTAIAWTLQNRKRSNNYPDSWTSIIKASDGYTGWDDGVDKINSGNVPLGSLINAILLASLLLADLPLFTSKLSAGGYGQADFFEFRSPEHWARWYDPEKGILKSSNSSGKGYLVKAHIQIGDNVFWISGGRVNLSDYY